MEHIDREITDALDWLFEEWANTEDEQEKEDIRQDIKALLHNNIKGVPDHYYKKASNILRL